MLQYLTFKKLDSICLEMAQLGESDLFPNLRQDIVNDRRYKLFGLLDGTNDPWWNRIITLTVTADQEILADFTVNAGLLTALSASAHTVTRSGGVFVAGSVLDIVLALRTTGARVAQYKAMVTVGGATGTYSIVGSVVGAETDYNSVTHTLFVNVMKKFSTTSADLSTQYIKNLIKIFDNAGPSGKERVFDLFTDARAFGEAYLNPYATKRVICLQYGPTLEFQIGATATALATVQALVKGKPSLYTDGTENNLLDSPPEENAMLEDEIAAEYARQAGKDIPTDVQSRLEGKWKAVYEAAAANRVKAMETNIGQRSV